MNGVILDPSDYTASNGTSVVLASGAAANDLVNIYAFKSFTVADTVSASAGGTFSANVAITGDLTVDTNTLHVDATNNRVGVGTASPAAPLTVQSDSNTLSLRLLGRSSDDRSDLEFYENDGTTKIGTISAETNNVSIVASGSDAVLSMTANTSRFRNASGTELGRWLSGGGLTFNGDTAAANALDHFEIGSWTPTYGGSSSNPSVTTDIQYGHYTKIGNIVIATFGIGTDAASGGSGSLLVNGLPFSSKSDADHLSGPALAYSFNQTISDMVMGISANTTAIILYSNNNSASTFATGALIDGANKNRLQGTVIYAVS
jgi:hypothetical protein